MMEKNIELLWALADGGRDRQINSAQGTWHSFDFADLSFPLNNIPT